jgi:hypothetical protein
VTLLTGLEVLQVRWAPAEGVWIVWFEAAYPGETYCRSEVRLLPSALGGPGGAGECARVDASRGPLEDHVVRVARDQLVTVLEREGRPVSVVIGVDAVGVEMLERGFPG